MLPTVECEVLLQPESDALRFLPEGPYSLGNGRMSWVAIQHGAESETGSVNILDATTRENTTHLLPGRPGFAFPAGTEGHFVCGVERSLGIFNTLDGTWNEFAEGVDSKVENTIINDGVVFEDNLIFGCKDLKFETKKAGLYLWRGASQQLVQLRDDQVCSNGKAVQRDTDGNCWLIDIDTPTKTVTRGRIDFAAGTLGEQNVILDLTAEDRFPDGMILTPDGESMIIAFYDPGDPPFGVARQYSLENGDVEREWRCPGSPRVTCPQLVEFDGGVQLVLTTAVEHMEPEQQQRCPHAGFLFYGRTDFTSVGDQPAFPVV